jgi:hypothetical protein
MDADQLQAASAGAAISKFVTASSFSILGYNSILLLRPT